MFLKFLRTYITLTFQNGRTILTVMLGGKWFDQHFGSNAENEKLLEIAQDHIKKILNIDKKPANFLVSVMTNCIPQYIVGMYHSYVKYYLFKSV